MSRNGIGTKPRIAHPGPVSWSRRSRAAGSIAHIHSLQNQTVGGVDPAVADAADIAGIEADAVAPVVAPAAVTPAAAMTPPGRSGGRRKGGRADGDGCSESKHSLTEHDDFSCGGRGFCIVLQIRSKPSGERFNCGTVTNPVVSGRGAQVVPPGCAPEQSRSASFTRGSSPRPCLSRPCLAGCG